MRIRGRSTDLSPISHTAVPTQRCGEAGEFTTKGNCYPNPENGYPSM